MSHKNRVMHNSFSHHQHIRELMQVLRPPLPSFACPELLQTRHGSWYITELCPCIYAVHISNKERSLIRVGCFRSGYETWPYECVSTRSLWRYPRKALDHILNGRGLQSIVLWRFVCSVSCALTCGSPNVDVASSCET
jgi:hypothetical protein